MVPTGGVSLANVGDFFAAGASAVAVGSTLVSGEALAAGDYQQIEETTREFLEAVAQARV